MTKLLISLYILAVLMIAGFAHAGTSPFHTEVIPATQAALSVRNVNFDENSGLLKISGPISQQCSENQNVAPVIRFFAPTHQLYVSVNANPDCIINDGQRSYEVAIDLNAYFAQHPIAQNINVNLSIENYSNSFNYLAKSSSQYDFNNKVDGVVSWNSDSKEFVLKTDDEKTLPLFPNLDLKDYENKKVSVSGIVMNDDNSHFYIGQLVVIK